MRDYTLQFPTLFKTATSMREFTEEDFASTRILYLVHGLHTGMRVAKNRVVRDLAENLLIASMDGDRFVRQGLGNRFQWGMGINNAEREDMYLNGINLVCSRPGYGPSVTSQQVRKGVSISSLIAMVTAMEYLVGCMAYIDMREFPYVEKNFMFYVKSTVEDILHELERRRFISRRGMFNTYKLETNDKGDFQLTIGYLSVKVQKDDSNQIYITYDEATERMVRDNYGGDYVYS
jgi:hypothetical protein